MKSPKEIAQSIADDWTRLDGEHKEDVIEAMVEAIEADRAQRAAGEKDPIIPADEDFPDRPQHLDFARISAAANFADDLVVNENVSPADALGIDDDSLRYAAVNRSGRALESMGAMTLLASPVSVMAATWLDGFAVGMHFERRGGARPADAGTAGEKEGSL